jgi:hypothetical protein
MPRPEPHHYTLYLNVDVIGGTAAFDLTIYDEHGTEPLHHVTQPITTTFCYTWKDLVEQIERHFMLAGAPNFNLSRPSPYLDLS